MRTFRARNGNQKRATSRRYRLVLVVISSGSVHPRRERTNRAVLGNCVSRSGVLTKPFTHLAKRFAACSRHSMLGLDGFAVVAVVVIVMDVSVRGRILGRVCVIRCYLHGLLLLAETPRSKIGDTTCPIRNCTYAWDTIGFTCRLIFACLNIVAYQLNSQGYSVDCSADRFTSNATRQRHRAPPPEYLPPCEATDFMLLTARHHVSTSLPQHMSAHID